MKDISSLRLVLPDSAYLSSYVEALREGFRFGLHPQPNDKEIDEIEHDPTAHFLSLNLQSGRWPYQAGLEVERSQFPFSYLWAVEGYSFIGAATLHFSLNDFLEQQAGNLGYAVRPSLQRRGYAKKICALQLDMMRQLGLASVLVMAGEWNEGSWRVIEANGGRLVNKVPSAFVKDSLQRRYCIELNS